MFVDPTVTAETTYYYWIRFVSVAGVFGPWSNMVSGATLPDVNFLIGKLSDAITESELASALRGKIVTPEQQYVVKIGTATGAISGAPTTFTSVAAVNGSEVLTVTFSSLVNTGSGAIGIGDVLHITGCSAMGGNITQAVLQQRYSVSTIDYSANTLTITARTAGTDIGAGLADADLLIVDDNSPDNTADKIINLQKTFKKLFLIKRNGKLGLDTAHKEGYQYALKNNYDYLITMDADFTHNPKYINLLFKQIKDNDIIVGTRFKNKNSKDCQFEHSQEPLRNKKNER